MFDDLLTELWELSEIELDERIRANEVEQRRLHAEQAALITMAEHRGLPAAHSHRSINAYLRQTINCSSADAVRLKKLARAVDGVDGLGEAWLAGRIGGGQATRLAAVWKNTRVRDQLPEFAPLLLDQAEQFSYRDFSLCVDRFEANADQDGAHDERDEAVEHRDARVVDVGGMVDIGAHGGDGVTSAELIAIFGGFCEREYRLDCEARRAEFGPDADRQPLARTARQRRFDALVTIFRTAATADGVGGAGEPVVNIVIDASTWAELLTATGLTSPDGGGLDPDLIATLIHGDVPLDRRRCETSTGIQVHPHDVLRAALAGHVRRVVVDANSVVIDMGRKQRLFSGSARQAAQLLLVTCEHPGCELSAEICDVDHVTEWSSGGSTDQRNAGARCGGHNTAKHRNTWNVKRAVNGRNYTIRQDGTIVLPAGARPPIFPAEAADDDADGDHTPDEIRRFESLARRRTAALNAA